MKRPNKLILSLLIAGSLVKTSSGQVSDDFSDGDLTQDPSWVISNISGTGADFMVAAGELQSNGPAASGSIWVSAGDVQALDGLTTTWTFYVRYASAPSSSNHVKIYLTSDRQDLSTDPQGYFMRLGESGASDGIDLFKTSSSTAVIEDPNPSIATGINTTIRITRDATGNWLLEADLSGGTDFIKIGSGHDTEFSDGQFFGIKVQHTSTRNRSFYFDNIAVNQWDGTPPEIAGVNVDSETQLSVIFSEKIAPAMAENTANYMISPSIGEPASAILGADQKQVTLKLPPTLVNGTTYELRVTEMEDLAGNKMIGDSAEIFYFQSVAAWQKAIIINEILPDPDPPNDLPQTEYIELFNNSNQIFDLAGWSISDQSTAVELPSFYLYPQEYVTLCPMDAASAFQSYGKVLGLTSWPTLNNSGDQLTLKDPDHNTIDSVAYQRFWYTSSSKAGGGWSLELIDPANLCSNHNNWADAEDVSGGTPGRENSVRSEKPDLTGPALVQVLAFAPDSIILSFDEILDPESVANAQFKIVPDLTVSNLHIAPDLSGIYLSLSGALLAGTEHSITITQLADCSGNLIAENTTSFYPIQPADSADIVINEILFNPRTGGVDFVELYNRSQKHINLRKWMLANGHAGQPEAEQIKIITDKNFLLAPKEYVAVTTDPVILQEQYPLSPGTRFMESPFLPSLPDAEGTVILLRPDSALMDRLDYSENDHFQLLQDPEGVSLERINAGGPAANPQNWKSAASTVGFATPGYENSHSRMSITTVEGKITTDPKIIIPDGSGQNSFTTISYAFPQSGFVANVRIVDVYGRKIKVLGENEYLPSEGFFTWDGTDDNGRRARIGYYLVFFEVFDLNGDLMRFKEKVVVGSRF